MAAPRSDFIRVLMNIGWNLIPAVTFVGIVFIWAGAVRYFSIPSYLLPGPGSVFALLISDAGMLWENSKTTIAEILLGFGLTLVTAIPLGLVIALSPL
ncbi:MAG: hypothetical protein ACTHJV_15595, partial [Rhizobiaceae bacterium]